MGDEVRPNQLRGGTGRPNALAATGRGGGTGGHGESRLLGPNSEAVLALFRRLARVGPVEAARLVGAWRGVPRSGRDRAHSAAQAAAVVGERRDAARTAQEQALAWLDQPLRLIDAPSGQGVSMGATRDEAQLQREAMPAVLDAVAAVVLGDLLTLADVAALYGPWAEAMSRRSREARGRWPPCKGPTDPVWSRIPVLGWTTTTVSDRGIARCAEPPCGPHDPPPSSSPCWSSAGWRPA